MHRAPRSGEVIRLVSGPHNSLEISTVMQCNDFAHEYLVEHPLLMSFLTCPDVWERTFQTFSVADFPKLASLFSSNDSRLLEMLATNLRFAETFFSPIRDLSNPKCAAAAESLTRLTVRAFCRRPREMAELLYISDRIFEDIIGNLRYPIVWQIVESMLRQHPLVLVPLIWFLFGALRGECIGEGEQRMIRLVHWVRKRRVCVGIDDPATRTVAVNLLGVFFSQTGVESDQLRRVFLAHMMDLREFSLGESARAVFGLAKILVAGLGDHANLDELIRPLIVRAFEIIRGCDSVNDPEAIACLDFLPVCPAGLGQDDVLAVLAKILKQDWSVGSDFAPRSALALVSASLQGALQISGKEDWAFRRRVEEIIAESWKIHRVGEMANTCLDILAVVRPGLLRRLGANWREIAAKELPSAVRITKDEQRTSGAEYSLAEWGEPDRFASTPTSA
jgi:hypothetical protein